LDASALINNTSNTAGEKGRLLYGFSTRNS